VPKSKSPYGALLKTVTENDDPKVVYPDGKVKELSQTCP
jgi:hypothetical protein